MALALALVVGGASTPSTTGLPDARAAQTTTDGAQKARSTRSRLQGSGLTRRRALLGRTRRPAPTPTPVALGTAVWWGCVDTAFVGPPPLACRTDYDGRYETAARGFDHFSPENELKERWIHPARDRWDFAVADRMAAWARSQGKEMRGHALIFGEATPGWKNHPLALWSKERLLADLRTHITTTMTHFAEEFPGVVRDWDVVNEPFEDDGSYERNVYFNVLGPSYVEEAFRAARAADPDATLVLNEFDADRPGIPRSESVYRMARDFVRRGVPLDAIGMQMHLETRKPVTRAELDEQFRRYGELGLEVQYTELDVQSPHRDRRVDPQGIAAEQDALLALAAGACAAAPNCSRVTSWGVADHHSWRGAEQLATLLTSDFAAKPIFAELRRLLSRRAG